MKLRTLKLLLPVLSLIFLLASCSKTNKQGKLIPGDASVVMHLNGEALSAKLPWDEIKGNVLFQKLYADSTLPAFIKKILDNPENSGINIKSDLLFFLKNDSLGSLIGVEGNIKDAEKFKLFNLDITEGGSESEQDGVNYISRSPLCVGWTKEKFVYVFGTAPISINPGKYGRMPDAFGKPRDIGATCKSIFDLKEKNSLSTNEKFTDLVKKEGDIHLWVNSEELNKGTSNIPMLNMMKLDKLYEGSVTTATANFESGKITVDYKTYPSKLLSDLLKKYEGGSINEDMLKRIPAKDVAAVFALHFKPEGLQELLKVMGMEGLANMALSQMGFSVEDFIKANKGDILIALTDFTTKNDTTVFDNNGHPNRIGELFHTQPDFLFAASIGDKEAFNKLITAGNKIFGSMGDNSSPMPFSMMSGISYNTNANYFAIGNSKTNVDNYIAGGSNTNFDFISKLSGNPFGAYVNLQYIMKAFEGRNENDSSAKAEFEASLKMWDNIYVTGGKYSGGTMSYNMQVNLVDKSTNSLKQLNQYLGKVGQVMLEEKRRPGAIEILKGPHADTTFVVPIPAPLKKNK